MGFVGLALALRRRWVINMNVRWRTVPSKKKKQSKKESKTKNDAHPQSGALFIIKKTPSPAFTSPAPPTE